MFVGDALRSCSSLTQMGRAPLLLLWPTLINAAGWGFDLPLNATQVLLNIGCNLAPVLPDDDNADAVVLCFEPIPHVLERIPKHPRLLTIPAAVSSFEGVATMHTYAKNAQSSSLGARAKAMDWNDDAARGDGQQFIVPVLSLRSIYASLGDVHVPYLKTDMQGADFAAVSSLSIDVLRRTPFLLTEVWLENVQSYVGFKNDFCRHWLPFMTRAGYSLQFMRLIYRERDNFLDQAERDAWSAPWAADPHARCAEDLALFETPTTGCYEADAHWIRNDTLADIAAFRGPKRPPVKELTDWPMSWHNS